jgi:hypothetical protein
MLNEDRGVVGSRLFSVGSMTKLVGLCGRSLLEYSMLQASSSTHKPETKGPVTQGQEPAPILCDNMPPLQAASELNARGIPLCPQRLAGHSYIPRNKAADKLAKLAVGPGKMHPCRLVSQEMTAIRNQVLRDREHEWKTSKNGAHLRRLNIELPAIRKRRLHDPLTRNLAYLLT